jgi:predicted RNase H-like nuclease (RuvC/YqgF family)
MQSISDYNHAKRSHPKDTAKMEEARSTIVDFTESLLKQTTQFKASSKSLQQNIDKFEQDTYSNWASLNARLEEIKRRLDQDEREHLETVIKGLQTTSMYQRWEYDNGMQYLKVIN